MAGRKMDQYILSAGRAGVGAFAGVIFGLLLEVVYLEIRGPLHELSHYFYHFENGVRLPVIGPGVGAVVLAVFAARFGAIEIRGLWRHMMIGLLAGLLIGAFAGKLVIPAVMARYEEIPPSDPFEEKRRLGYEIRAFPRAAVAGMALGLIAGILYHVTRSGCIERSATTTTERIA